MRTLSTLLLVLVAFAGNAQKFSLGIATGYLIHTAPFNNRGAYDNVNSEPKLSFDARAALKISKFQLGFGLMFSRQVYDYENGRAFLPHPSNPVYTFRYEGRYTNPYLFLNFRRGFGRSSIYAGVNAGYVSLANGDNTSESYGWYTVNVQRTNGFAGGMQLGGRVRILGGLRTFAEAGIRYVTVAPDFTPYANPTIILSSGTGFWTLPLLAGVEYEF